MADQATGTYTVMVRENGPLLVTGNVTLRRMAIVPEGDHYRYEDKGVIEHDEMFGLCRCGLTKTAPFCDRTHQQEGFDGTETAPRTTYAERAKRIEGDGITLLDDFDMCALARFCHTDKGKIWELMQRSGEPGVNDQIAKAANECPAGRLVAVDQATGEPMEDDYPNEIIVLEDSQLECGGPLWLRGDFTVVAADGEPYEKHSKYTLCRCGHSQAKPFCDCKHAHERWSELA